jgi:hypothetical protein
MKKTLSSIVPVLAVTVVIGMAAGMASAQDNIQQVDVFTTNYFSNNTTPGAPAAALRFTEQQSQAVRGVAPAQDYLQTCAMIYVYAADQQLAECCGCPVTLNGLVYENVQKDLLGNTLTRVVPNEGVIQIVSGLYESIGTVGYCDPTDVIPVPEINSWVTHVQNKVGTGFPITESRGDEVLLTDGELTILEADCSFAMQLGSGFGVCTCNKEAVK